MKAPDFSKWTFSAPTWMLVPLHLATATHRSVKGTQMTTSQSGALHRRDQRVDQMARLGGGHVHFPVAGNDGFTILLIHDKTPLLCCASGGKSQKRARRPCRRALRLLRVLDNGNAGQFLALEVLERSTAASGDVGHLVAQAHLLDSSRAVAAADNGWWHRSQPWPWQRASVPAARVGFSKTPMGPFHTTVLLALTASSKQLHGLGADVAAFTCRREWP